MVLGIYGSGGNGTTIVDGMYILGFDKIYKKIIFIDDVVGIKEVYGHEVYTFDEVKQTFSCDELEILISLGEPADRKMLFNKIKEEGYRLANGIISPRANMPLRCKIGEGSILFDCTIGSDVIIGENTFVSENVIIGHNTVIGNHGIISAQAFVAGHCKIGDEVYIGPSSSIRDRLTIEDTAVVALGAVVLKDVSRNSIAIGNPARNIHKDENYRIFN